MAWKGRKMFSSAVDMQSGGTVPYPSYRGGGAVGATPVERKKMFSIWDKMTKGQKENVMDGKRYQMGGKVMPTQLFEQGDQDINMALNTMASMTNPSIEDISKMETKPMGMGMGEMSKDQGPSGFENALKNLKQDFYDEISGFVMKTKDMEKVQSYLKNMSVAYSNSLQKLKKEFGITEAFPNEQLLTPSFLTEIKNMLTAPGMQEGGSTLAGLVQKPEDLAQYGLGSFPWNVWQGLSNEEKERLLKAGGSALLGTQQVDTTKQQQLMERINNIIEERKELAKKSAVMPQTKQGGILGFASQMNAYRANQATARDKVLADELEMIRLGNQLSSRAQGQGPQFTATIRDAIFDDDEGPIIDKKKIYESVMSSSQDLLKERKLGNSSSTDHASVVFAMQGHSDIVEAHDRTLAVIKTYNGAPTSFADFIIAKIRAAGTFDPKQSSVYVNEFRALPVDEPVNEGV
jgi:hypothetical protein